MSLLLPGNGEPTSHPDFDLIIDDTIELRDRYFPNAKISVLSNSTFLAREKVVKALAKCGQPDYEARYRKRGLHQAH